MKKMKNSIKSFLFLGIFLVSFSVVLADQGITSYVGYNEDNIIENMNDCEYQWDCNDWSNCLNRKQTRNCVNLGSCHGDYDKPLEEKDCLLEIPKQLFDIKLELNENYISSSQDLKSWVRFESFGTEPTPVNLTYTILDNQGTEIYRESESLIVYTEEFVIKSFSNLDLDYGKYDLYLKIDYSNVTEDFKQDFEVKEETMVSKYGELSFVSIILLLAIFLILRRAIRNKKRNERKINSKIKISRKKSKMNKGRKIKGERNKVKSNKVRKGSRKKNNNNRKNIRKK